MSVSLQEGLYGLCKMRMDSDADYPGPRPERVDDALARSSELRALSDHEIALRLKTVRDEEDLSWMGMEERWSLGGNQGGIRIGILLVPDVHNRLALFIYIIQHANKVLLIIAVVTIALGYHGLYLLQSALNTVVHNRNRNFLIPKLIHLVYHKLANMSFLFICKFGQGPVCALSNGIDYLLDVKSLSASILFYDGNILCRFIFSSVINCLCMCLFKTARHFTHSLHLFQILYIVFSFF